AEYCLASNLLCLHLKDARLVNATGEHSATIHLLDSQSFSSYGGLVDESRASDYDSVDWDPLSVSDNHDLAWLNRLYVCLDFCSIPSYQGPSRNGLFQLEDGCSSFVDCVGFYEF